MKIEEIIKSKNALTMQKKTVLNLIYTQIVISERFNEILKPHEISSEQFNVLRILRGQKGSAINMNDIQTRMIAKNSNTTRLIDKLLLKDLVTRKVCPHNRRKIEVEITQKGLDLLTILDPIVINHEEKFANNLTNEELQLFNNLLEKYRN
jgi:DNA-binding MarR family transcriptional regulator